jgi:hypothetical protein
MPSSALAAPVRMRIEGDWNNKEENKRNKDVVYLTKSKKIRTREPKEEHEGLLHVESEVSRET